METYLLYDYDEDEVELHASEPQPEGDDERRHHLFLHSYDDQDPIDWEAEEKHRRLLGNDVWEAPDYNKLYPEGTRRYLMSIRHSLMRSATPRFREKFTCTFVGTGRNVRYAFLHILPVLQPWWDFPGNYCWRELLLGTHGPSHELRGACGGSRSGQPPC